MLVPLIVHSVGPLEREPEQRGLRQRRGMCCNSVRNAVSGGEKKRKKEAAVHTRHTEWPVAEDF